MMRSTPWQSRAHCFWFRLCNACLSVYVAYIAYLAHSGLFQSKGQTIAALLIFAALCVGLYLFFGWGCQQLSRWEPKNRQKEHLDWRVFGAGMVIALGIFGCAFAAVYPGGVNYDLSNQWRQLHSGEFNNWHPLLHTLLLWLVTRIRDSYPFVVLVQIIVFAAALSCFTATLHRCSAPAWLALIVHAFVALSLPVRNTLMYPGKDAAMTIGILILCAQGVRILYTGGEWLKKPLHWVLFGLALAYTGMVRHNGMMWTLVLLAGVFFALPARKHTALAAGVMAAVMLLVQGPLYGALDVVYPSNFTEESVGLPMTVLGDIRQKEPEVLDGETLAFLNQLADEDAWQRTYQQHNYNSIKFTYPREYIKDTPVTDILSMALRSAIAAPRTAFEAVNGLTDIVWDITGQDEGYSPVNNSGGIPEATYGNTRLNQLGQKALRLLDTPMGWQPLRYFGRNIGVQLLLLLLTTLLALYRRGVRALVLTLPTLIYDLGTMLLLCGNDARFFQFSMTISLGCMLALIYLPKEEKE